MIKSKALLTVDGQIVNILHEDIFSDLFEVMKKNRDIKDERFFAPKFSDLHDPFLLPDMEKAVERILRAREREERIIIFGDYDVDGVSSTALLVRYLGDIGCQASYRLPHRVHDGYGLKEYFFDELKEKNVKLVITVDCGTRDIRPIHHARSLGIDVIITDHHAVPDIIPEEVIALINPKRADSTYPFRDLSGSGVAFKVVQALARTLKKDDEESICREYIDLASLGTVADCMPLQGENRVITTLGLRQMSESRSAGIRNFLRDREKDSSFDADIIGFHIGPRINAAGRMDTPLTALNWLLASSDKADGFFAELEHWNDSRKHTTETHLKRALETIDTTAPLLIYDSPELEHGIIGLVAGKLTEIYGKPTIILKNGGDHVLTRKKGDDINPDEGTLENTPHELSIASCRSPEWCSIIELLESCKEYFIRFGGHRQAAGFTIETARIPEFRQAMTEAFKKKYDIHALPKKTVTVECTLDPRQDIGESTVDTIDRFRPFGIGNMKPLFLLRDVTIRSVRSLGKGNLHREIRIMENPDLKILSWKVSEEYDRHMKEGNILSLIVELEKTHWNGKSSISLIIKNIIP